MISLASKPAGSSIEVQNELTRTTLSWHNPRGGIRRIGISIFLTAWLGGWAMGEYSAAHQLVEQPIQMFLVFWLAGWTVGGVFVLFTLFRLLQPSRPERIILDSLSLTYEPGTELFSLSDNNWWKAIQNFRSRKVVTAQKNEIGEVKLDRVGERQRLTFDYGSERVEVGTYIQEPEREWLFTVLRSWKGVI
jgi:hypothetical protein